MPELRFDLFAAASDEEAARYRVLDGLQRIRQAFARNEVYPFLSDLIHLHGTLVHLTSAADAVHASRPGRAVGIDLEEGRLIYDKPDAPNLLAADLARWVLPMLAEVIDEGRVLFDFVEQHAEIRPVGILPSYQDEGYLLIPTPPRVRVIRYAMSLFEEPGGRYRGLRTANVGTADTDALPSELKRWLIENNPELPNPATYRVDTDVDFPVDATLLPVAKRKLLQYLALGGAAGAA